MQSAIGRSGRSRSSRRVLWVVVLGIGLGIVLVAVNGAVWFASSQPSYRRFVSQPLPDGSRYTFLYPSNLQVIREGRGNPSPGVIANVRLQSSGPVNAPPSPSDRLRRLMGLTVP